MLAAEMSAERDGVRVSRETLRGWMAEAGTAICPDECPLCRSKPRHHRQQRVRTVRDIGAAGITLQNAQGREGLVKWDTCATRRADASCSATATC